MKKEQPQNHIDHSWNNEAAKAIIYVADKNANGARSKRFQSCNW